MQPVYLQLTAESEESKAEETIVLSNETLLQNLQSIFPFYRGMAGKLQKGLCEIL